MNDTTPNSQPSEPDFLIILRKTWRIYLADGFLLFIQLVIFFLLLTFLETWKHPLISDLPGYPHRTVILGIVLWITLNLLIYSPLGAFSGAQMNPAITIAYWRIKRINTINTIGYITSQFIFGTLALLFSVFVLGKNFTENPIHYAPVRPGILGVWSTGFLHLIISFFLMILVLKFSNTPKLKKWTGFAAATFSTFSLLLVTPLTTLALNPVRSIISAIPAGEWKPLTAYLVFPVLGMLIAVEIYRQLTTKNPRTFPAVACCKLNHQHTYTCPHCQPEEFYGKNN